MLWPIPFYSCTRYHSLSVARIYISSNYIWPCTLPTQQTQLATILKSSPLPYSSMCFSGQFWHFHPDSQVGFCGLSCWVVELSCCITEALEGFELAEYCHKYTLRMPEMIDSVPYQQKYKDSVGETTKQQKTQIFDFREVKHTLWLFNEILGG